MTAGAVVSSTPMAATPVREVVLRCRRGTQPLHGIAPLGNRRLCLIERLLQAVFRFLGIQVRLGAGSSKFGARSHRGGVHQDNDDHYLVLRLARYQETLLTSLLSVNLRNDFDEYAYAAVVADGISPAPVQ